MFKKSLITIALLYLTLSNVQASNEEFYNKKPKSDDVLINMPCDLKMVFKKVYTSYKQDKINDMSFNAGNLDGDDHISQSPHKLYVQGSFIDNKGIYYLISKYEISAMQYDAILQDKCPSINRKNALPIVNISWFDAINYTRYLNQKVKKLQSPFLEANKDAYIRLPTDSEWEFASRGGLNVSLAELESPLPPMNGKSLRDFAFYQGSESSNGNLHISGLLSPNALDLYDMLGNVQEMILEPFSATRTGRLHGQRGGFIVRGGGFLTNKNDISSALRIEKPFFINSSELKAKDIGMRLVIAAPVIQDRNEISKLNTKIANLGYEEASEKESTIKKLDTLIKENKNIAKEKDESNKERDLLAQKNENLVKSLQELRDSLITVNVAREELRDKNIVSSIRLGAHLCAYISTAKSTYTYDKSTYDKFNEICKNNNKFDRCKILSDLKNKYEGERAVLDYFINYYADHLVQTHENYDKKHISSMVKDAKNQVSNITKKDGSFDVGSNMNKFIDIFIDDVNNYKASKNINILKQKIEKKCGI